MRGSLTLQNEPPKAIDRLQEGFDDAMTVMAE